MIVAILSFLDVVGGSLLTFQVGGLLAIAFGLFHFFKGIFSLGSSYAVGYLFDWMGWVDLITGVGLFLFSENVFVLSSFGLITLLKGVYCLALSAM